MFVVLLLLVIIILVFVLMDQHDSGNYEDEHMTEAKTRYNHRKFFEDALNGEDQEDED